MSTVFMLVRMQRWTGNVVFQRKHLYPYPSQGRGFRVFTNTGTLPRPTLTISNLRRHHYYALLLLINATTAGNDLGGAEVRRIRTLKKFSGWGSQLLIQTLSFLMSVGMWIEKLMSRRDSVTFELASKFDLAGQKLPKASGCSECLPVGVSQQRMQLYGHRLLRRKRQ